MQTYLEQQEPVTPNFFKMISAGHQPVKADWTRFTPIKVVQISHQGLTQIASATLIRMKVPAITRIIFSTLMKTTFGVSGNAER
jgi:hypothetical protein